MVLFSIFEEVPIKVSINVPSDIPNTASKFFIIQQFSKDSNMAIKAWYKLSVKSIKRLTCYYVFLLLTGLIISVLTLLYDILFDCKIHLLVATMFGGIGTSLFGSSMFYLRKLYKSCINLEFNEPISNEDQIRQTGIKAYYYLRPIFSIVFSLLVQITQIINVNIVTVSDTTLSIGYLYMTMFLSFFAGFASGDLITYFESKGPNIITRVFHQN